MDITKNPILYVDMMNSIALGADVLYKDKYALLIRDQHSEILYATAVREESALQMIAHLPTTFDILVSHDELTNAVLRKHRGLTYENQCYHCAHLSNKQFDIQVPHGYVVKRVTKEYLNDVITLYAKEIPTLANEEYMGLTIDAGMFGIFKHTTLCGFIGVHEDGYGSIGMLEVKETYRRLGFATLLEKIMINEQIRRGHLPYGEIFIENVSSLRLQERVGMQISKDLTYWFYG